jgi:hypothetical protein
MNPTALFVVALFAAILLFAVALNRKGDQWNEAVTRVNQLEAELRRLRGDRAGLQAENAFLSQRNAELETLLQPNAMPKGTRLPAGHPQKRVAKVVRKKRTS